MLPIVRDGEDKGGVQRNKHCEAICGTPTPAISRSIWLKAALKADGYLFFDN
jgi:hypothetical protein